RQRQHFEINRLLSPRRPIAWEKLDNAFQAVQEKYAAAATDAYDFIEQHGESLAKHFKLGWGNRLQHQMEHYVPVVIAAGGSLGEAADHILASKLLRKLKDRYDNRPEDLKDLRDKLKTGFKGLQFKEQDSQSIAILNDELHRLGEDA
ncbi:MAG: hypothetical protein GY862_31175, partial [Gammaproteobacteria bacterium]|nr:hypothetical protein [Gammaproteobacteria bacterium]